LATALLKDDPLENSYIVHIAPLRLLDLNTSQAFCRTTTHIFTLTPWRVFQFLETLVVPNESTDDKQTTFLLILKEEHIFRISLDHKDNHALIPGTGLVSSDLKDNQEENYQSNSLLQTN